VYLKGPESMYVLDFSRK